MRQHEGWRDSTINNPDVPSSLSLICIRPIDIWLAMMSVCWTHLLSIRKQSVWRAWAGLGGTQRRVIAADRKYQAFNYQQCYHIIATNKSVTTDQRWGASSQRWASSGENRFCYVNSRHGRQKNSINFWIILMSQLSSLLLCLVNYGPETTRSNYFKQTFKLFHFGPRLCFHCSAEI